MLKFTEFQLVEPSLNEIFISTVGEDNLKKQQLGGLKADELETDLFGTETRVPDPG
jgi:hypothetical protein